MRALIVRERGVLELRDDVPEPQPGPYQALAKILACSICSSTDVKIIDGTMPYVMDYPCVLGHESVGEIVQVGEKVRHLRPGDRVLRPTAVYPGEKLGEFYSGWGGFAEYGLVTDLQAMIEDGLASPLSPPAWPKYQQIIPREIDPVDATMLITLKETLNTLEDAGVAANQRVLVVGDGCVGVAFARWAKLKGATFVAVAGHHESRLERARKLGADAAVNTTGQGIPDALKSAGVVPGFDLIIDAVGSGEIVEQCIGLLAAGGRLAIYGVSDHMDAQINLLRIPASAWIGRPTNDESRAHEQVLSYWRMGAINLKDFYTHVVPLDRAEEGFQLIRSREAFKVVITIA